MSEVIDWIRHLRVKPLPSGIYPHPGMWFTRGDYSEHWIMGWVMDLDMHLFARLMCFLGAHRWVTTWRPGEQGTTHCWYCEHPK